MSGCVIVRAKLLHLKLKCLEMAALLFLLKSPVLKAVPRTLVVSQWHSLDTTQTLLPPRPNICPPQLIIDFLLTLLVSGAQPVPGLAAKLFQC